MDEAKRQKIESLKGTPFKRLPGEPPEHRVVGELTDGFKVRAHAVEMVWNDSFLMDAIEGDGTYEKLVTGDGSRNAEVLALAKRLYGGAQ